MRLCSLGTGDDVGIVTERGITLLSSVNRVANTAFGPGLLDIIRSGQLASLRSALQNRRLLSSVAVLDQRRYAPPYRDPPKLWGVGLNFARHAEDLEVEQPTDVPGSYLRPASTIIGDGDTIILPPQSRRVTAEAELGIVIGTTCRDVSPADAASVIFGLTAVLDMTAEDAIRVNPRYIPWAKAFDTFCSIGPWVVSPDEICDLSAVRISTVVNGRTVATDFAAAMLRDPHWLVSHFSAGMTLEAGTIISTGTPGAGVIRHGDLVEARVEGIGRLHNRVRRANGHWATQQG